MDMEKENKRVQGKSKIPLQSSPLLPLPQNLSKRPQELETERHPLKTINQQTFTTGAIPKTKNSEKNNLKTKCPPKVDTRHVTVRQNAVDLDWNYQVFNDNVTKDRSSVIIISDDDEEVNEENCLGNTKKALTPALKSPTQEPNRTKNIKKSLKRPHTRELLGISRNVKPDRRDERHKRLEFIQFSQDGLHSPEYLDYTEDLFPYLLSIETKTAVPSISSEIRACIINWLIKVNGPNGNPAVIQSTQSYFDAVVAAGQVQLPSLQLFAAACYWIAQKNHGSAISARRLVKYSKEAFTIKDLVSAEQAVLVNILKFPTQPVIPQEYITYLSWSCDSDKSGEIEVAATVLCMAGLMVDKSLCNMYPSVIGAAAVKNAVLLLRGKEALVRLHVNSVYKSAESKVPNISWICSAQRKAIRCMSSPLFKYNAPLKYYENDSHLILQKVVKFANEFSDVE